jgi:hypothetical protein
MSRVTCDKFGFKISSLRKCRLKSSAEVLSDVLQGFSYADHDFDEAQEREEIEVEESSRTKLLTSSSVSVLSKLTRPYVSPIAK